MLITCTYNSTQKIKGKQFLNRESDLDPYGTNLEFSFYLLISFLDSHACSFFLDFLLVHANPKTTFAHSLCTRTITPECTQFPCIRPCTDPTHPILHPTPMTWPTGQASPSYASCTRLVHARPNRTCPYAQIAHVP